MRWLDGASKIDKENRVVRVGLESMAPRNIDAIA